MDTTAATSPTRRPIFAIFEGGGAKGVAHVGAMDAMNTNNLEIVGVGGTSAGALVAVLAAIGLDAADIMDGSDPGANILARNGTSPIKLLNEDAWRDFCFLRHSLSDIIKGGKARRSQLNWFTFMTAMPIVLSAWRRRGHFSTKAIQAFVNTVIRARLQQIKDEAGLDLEVPEEPTFGNLSERWPTVVPLKIVVTDVARGKLEVLDRHETPDVKVAEAVAASIAIPLVFEPARIPSFRPGLFADGGLVSNLPIWVFVDEKLRRERERDGDPPIPVIGFSLQPAGDEPTGPDRLPRVVDYIRTLAEAALAGSQATSHRFMEDLTVVRLKTEMPMLGFDSDWETLRATRESGRDCADRELRFRLGVKPERIRRELQAIHDEVLEVVNQRRRALRQRQVEQLRANLVRPWGNFSLRVVEGVHMVDDADDRLLLDRRGQGSALAFEEKGVRVLRCDPDPAHTSRVFMTKYERALVRPTVRSMICVPIFKDGEAWARDELDRDRPQGVLCLDSDDADMTADFSQHALVNLLVDKSSVLFAAINLEPDVG